ncbi:Glutathione biosynthesis bifunctional protein GshAB [Alishewanella longhuensis]
MNINLNLSIPPHGTETEFKKWSDILTTYKEWHIPKSGLTNNTYQTLNALNARERKFVGAYLILLRQFLELARVPLFCLPKVTAVVRSQTAKHEFTLSLALPVEFAIPLSAYQITLIETLHICTWLTKTSPTSTNKNDLFNTINQKIVMPLEALVPGAASTIKILKAASQVNIPFLHLGMGIYQLGWGSKAFKIDRAITKHDCSLGARLAQNKANTANLLRQAGLPAPIHNIVNNLEEAYTAATELGFPLVVKPIDLDRGEGVTTDIGDFTMLKSAVAHAQSVNPQKPMLVEKQARGVCHRLVIVNSALLYAVKRLPVGVYGNGVDSIASLIKHEMAVQAALPPWQRSLTLQLDQLALDTLQKNGLSPLSIPAVGNFVALKPIESTAWGGVDVDVTQQVHPDNLKAAIMAAQLFGLYVAGIDIISEDITTPWYLNNAIINEVNFSPLLGGAAISLSYLPTFIKKLIQDDGRIPINYIADEKLALARQQALLKQGHNCYLITESTTLDAKGNVLAQPQSFTLKQRVMSLLIQEHVSALVIVAAPANNV